MSSKVVEVTYSAMSSNSSSSHSYTIIDTVDRTVLSSEVIDVAYSAMSSNSSSAHSLYTFINGNETLIYTTNEGFEYDLDKALQEMLQGNVTGVYNNLDVNKMVPTATSQLMFAFSNSTNIPATMDRVATAITNRMRATSNITVSGQRSSVEPYVRVRWAWLILPASMIMAGIATLILAMTDSKKHGSHVWKSSEIALLFHGLDPPIPQAASMNTTSEMESWSKDVKIKLLHDSEGSVTLRRNL